MRVNNNALFGRNLQLGNQRYDEPLDAKKGSGKSIDASNLGRQLDPISVKKKEAQKRAMRIIKDALAKNNSIDTNVDEQRQKVRELTKELGGYRKEINKIENKREQLRNDFGVLADSTEQKDLDLLAKEAESKFKGSDVTLTKEEEERLKEIKKQDLTDYQKMSLEMKKSEGYYAGKIYDGERQIEALNAVIAKANIELNKNDGMVVAKKRANMVMERSKDQVLSMLFAEGKEHIDEDLEKKTEEVKEKREEEKELKERIEKTKDKKEEEREMIEEIIESTVKKDIENADMEGANGQVKQLMNKLKLLEEDIKGAAVDTEL